MLALRANIRPLSSRNLLRRLNLDPKCFRSVSTMHLDPAIRGFAAALLKKQPCFSMHPKDVDVLSEPQQFHQRLLVSHCRGYLPAETSFTHKPRFRTWSVAPAGEYLYRLYILVTLINAWSVNPLFLSSDVFNHMLR